MYRNDDPTVVAAAPAVPAATGTAPGFFTNGNPVAGTPATIVPDWWLTQLQEEPLSVIAAAGIAPVKGENNQLLLALKVLFNGTGALSQNGYFTIPGGLMLQWGVATLPASGGTVSIEPVVFPEPFPNAAFVVLSCPQSQANSTYGYTPTTRCYGLTTTGMDISGDTLTGQGSTTAVPFNQTVPVFWVALGH